jgi:hypothetical protein
MATMRGGTVGNDVTVTSDNWDADSKIFNYLRRLPEHGTRGHHEPQASQLPDGSFRASHAAGVRVKNLMKAQA